MKHNDTTPRLFESSEPNCRQSFSSFHKLELHLGVGSHDICPSSNVYDTIRKDWAIPFSNVHEKGVSSKPSKLLDGSPHLTMGWALQKTHGSDSSQFSSKVKEYLATKFEIGEQQTGQKADPQQVSVDMRNARDTNNKRKVFKTRMGLKNADKGLFLRLTAAKRRHRRRRNS